eukprot:7023779-Heterocapsa_arctica.AAC.1
MQKWANPAEAEWITRRCTANADVVMTTLTPGSTRTCMATAQLVRSIAQLTRQNSRELGGYAGALQHVNLLPTDLAVNHAVQKMGK